jgi:hypothetical protein
MGEGSVLRGTGVRGGGEKFAVGRAAGGEREEGS